MTTLEEVHLKIEKIQHAPPRIRRPDIKVLCIMDTFSYECWKYECKIEQLRFGSWKKQIDVIKPDFVLIESAWLGLNGKWRGRLVNINRKPNSVIKELIHYCKQKKVPTVFWNKEDSLNYSNFIHTAMLFDVIFTTDINCIEQYKQDAGHDRVYCLPFAAQPAIHNPIGSLRADKGNVAFAGTCYVRHAKRRENMELLLDPSREFGLEIFDRMFLKKTKRRFPQKYHPYILGTLDYNLMVKAYKLYKVFLNVNLVTMSTTMFSRRVFELLACGTNVISSYAKGIEEMFKDIVLLSDSKEDTKRHLTKLIENSDYSRRLSILGIREIYSKHLYKHRFDHILGNIGLRDASVDKNDGVSVITCLRNPQTLSKIFENFNRQVWDNKELILIIIANENAKIANIQEKVNRYQNVSLYLLPKLPFGECIKFATARARHNYISLFDEDHYYAPHFLTDLMHAFLYSHADIVGKGEREYQFVDSLCSTAMIAKKEVLASAPLIGHSLEEEQLFFQHCAKKHFTIYSNDKYNFVHNQTNGLPVHVEDLEV